MRVFVQTFKGALESLNFTTGRMHIYVEGTMLGVPTSSNDPIFYLHHCNVDRLYEEWLNTYSDYGSPSFEPNTFSYVVDHGHNIDEHLVPFFPVVTN